MVPPDGRRSRVQTRLLSWYTLRSAEIHPLWETLLVSLKDIWAKKAGA